MIKIYKSKFGYEVMLFLTLIFSPILMFMSYKNEPLEAILSVGGIFTLVYLFFLYICLTTKYMIKNDNTLTITCGFLYTKVLDINKIKSIAKTSNLMSSPAPSLDRIELTYGTFDIIIVSPNDKMGFANALKILNPNIENKLTH